MHIHAAPGITVVRDEHAPWDCTAGHPPGCVHTVDPHLPLAADEPEPPERDLAGHQRAWSDELDDLLRRFAAVLARWRTELAEQIEQAIDDGDLAALAALGITITDADVALLSESMAQLAAIAAGDVVSEAADGGVVITAAPPTVDEMGPIAQAVVALLAAGLAVAAGREALRLAGPGMVGKAVAVLVKTFLGTSSDRPQRDALGGALTGAQNAGRIATYRAAGGGPGPGQGGDEPPPDSDDEDGDDGEVGKSKPTGSLYADETLDESTCAPCRAISGRFICTIEDLSALDRMYTSMGGYVGCLGRERCRGTVTGVWRPATTEDS